MLTALSLLSAIILLTLGLVALLRSSAKTENKLFFLFALSGSLWTTAYVLIETPKDLFYVSLINKFAYAVTVILVYSALLFTYYYPRKKEIVHKKLFSLVAVLSVIMCFSDLLSGRVSRIGESIEFSYGPLIIPYTIILLTGLVIITRNLIHERKEEDAIQVKAVNLMLFGYISSLLFGLAAAVVIPSLFPSLRSIDTIAPLSLLVVTYSMFIAMSRYKLFDIRSVIARSIGYLSLVVFATVVYSLLGYLLNVFLSGNRSQLAKLMQDVAITVILILSYPYFKNKFDLITKKLFFKDAYDPQALLSELNRALVADAEIESLLTKAALVIQENFKADFCTFYIRQTSYFPNRFIGAHRKSPEIDDLEILNELSKKIHKKVHSTEVDPENEEERELNKVLRHNDVEVLARLVSRVDYEVNGIGFIFVGPKKSGSLYTAADLRILEIIANELVIAIENVLRFEEIEQFNVTLQKKIDSATNELQSSNDKLRALDEAKDEFVSMASHQLRTPLTSVKGYISMVLEGDAGKINDSQRQMLGQAMFSSQRMVYLIADLLNVSRLKTGKFVIEAKPIYLPDVVETELQQLHEGAVAKNITLVFDKPKKFPTIELDEMKIRQVIMNFTDNALYYTPNEGTITVGLKDKKDSIEFTVKDNGMGVPRAEQHKLFSKFYRAENARKARPDGTGLGLFMAKKVVVAQGGSIIFDSKEGKGSTFGFSFPKNRQIPQEAVTEDDQA